MKRSTSLLTALCALALLFTLPSHLLAQEEAVETAETAEAAETVEKAEKAPAKTLQIEKLVVTPEKPGVDTLCQLRVHVRNAGETTLTSLRFEVSLGGQSLPVYDKQLFLDELPPGETTEVRLYNFWTTETGRPAPKDGKLKLDVRLMEAQQVKITHDEDGTEVWTLGEAVSGLPAQASQTLALGSP